MAQNVEWSPRDLAYKLNKRQLKSQLPQGAADAVSQEAKARLSVISSRISNGDITLKQGKAEAKQATKIMVMAEKALARGGWDQMRPADWKNAEKDVIQIWEGNRDSKFPDRGIVGVFEDAEAGYFGPNLDRGSFSYWMQRPVNQGHAVYSNERTNLHREQGYVYAERLMSNVDNCVDCIGENEKVVPIADVLPIGESICMSSCRCEIIFHREDDATPVDPDELAAERQQRDDDREAREAQRAENRKEREERRKQESAKPKPEPRSAPQRRGGQDDDLVSVGRIRG